MEIHKVKRVEASSARGVVIVIDVLRAFSVAAYAFAGGAQGIWLVRTVEEALALRERVPEALLAGEIGGRLISGFDFNNSPSQMAGADVRNRLLIQRTGAGTQGAVIAGQADALLICSLTNARATTTYAHQLAQSAGGGIALFPTERVAGLSFNEDDVCADYLEALLLNRPDAQETLARNITQLRARGRFDRFAQGDADFPFEDVAAVLAVDRFSFAMVGMRRRWNDIQYIEVRRVDVP
ncbi:MAG TPA: 2-phosphosulfolactate phosphatase [Ktedonobacteraceae bacterium]|nr:2-phosphosulfolactate phosphatase [Ktedonobacteraceae bacterium]